MKYTQITHAERYMIARLKRQGFSWARIASIAGRHRSTIGREFKRNLSPDGNYRAEKANQKANGRRSRSRRNTQFTKITWNIIVRHIRLDYSPDQIVMELEAKYDISISHETIYRYIRKNRKAGGTLWKHLRCSRKYRRKRRNSSDNRGRLPGKKYIEERPMGAQNKSRIGHIEVDTVHGRGSKACVLTAVDRKSKFMWISLMKANTKKEVNKALFKIISKAGGRIKTITADNGVEFHGYKKIERKTGVKVYFAHPHHPWERGLNEHSNGLLRQYLPKAKSMAEVTQVQCNQLANKINLRRRRILNKKSPKMVYNGI